MSAFGAMLHTPCVVYGLLAFELVESLIVINLLTSIHVELIEYILKVVDFLSGFDNFILYEKNLKHIFCIWLIFNW